MRKQKRSETFLTYDSDDSPAIVDFQTYENAPTIESGEEINRKQAGGDLYDLADLVYLHNRTRQFKSFFSFGIQSLDDHSVLYHNEVNL